MAKYQVRIEEYEFDQTFSFDELVDNGLLDDADPRIQVRAVGESVWVMARQYPYGKKEKEKPQGFTINADGSVTRHTVPKHRPINTAPHSSTSTGSSGRSSSDDDWLLTIIYIIGKFVLAIIGTGILVSLISAIL